MPKTDDPHLYILVHITGTYTLKVKFNCVEIYTFNNIQVQVHVRAVLFYVGTCFIYLGRFSALTRVLSKT